MEDTDKSSKKIQYQSAMVVWGHLTYKEAESQMSEVLKDKCTINKWFNN